MARSENETSDSSSAEEEEVSSGSESESELEKTSTPPPSSMKTQPLPNSSSDETDSDSEPDTEKTLVAESKVIPLASKPMDDEKKSRSKNPTSRYSPPPIKQSTGKRSAIVGESGDSKRFKKKTVVAVAAPDAVNIGRNNNNNNDDGEKKQLFQRLWSENDEVELIKGMLNYVEEKGKDPTTDFFDFHEFVKKSLQIDVNNQQLITKVRRLKKKFVNNAARSENTGKVRSFSNPHEKKMYELSKTLWGSDSNNNVVMSSKSKKVNVTPKTNKNRKTSKVVDEFGSNSNGGGIEANPIAVGPKVAKPEPSGHQLGSMGQPITDELIMNKGLELVSGPKKVELEEKWKNIKMLELKCFIQKLELLKEHAEIVFNAMVESGDTK